MKSENSLAPLPFPVTFVSLESASWPELFSSNETLLDPDMVSSRRLGGIDSCWVILTYLHLKHRNLNVRLSDHFIPGEICVVSAPNYFPTLHYTSTSFVVGARGDGTRPAVCHFAISQNQFCVKAETDAFIPHWPQPGLVPRMQERGNRIETLVFKGDELAEEFRTPEFHRVLEQVGVKFLVNGKPKDGPINWYDYSHADLVLAVRDHFAVMKPASKLINAWHAGVPALLGPEPAFRELRQSPLDYIEVNSPQDVLDAIRRLQQNPDLYQQMIENGLKRAADFTNDRIAQRWRDVLAGPVAERYSHWRQQSQLDHQVQMQLKTLQQHIIWKKEKFGDFLTGHVLGRLPTPLSRKLSKGVTYWSLR
jgi:hypothetical protein